MTYFPFAKANEFISRANGRSIGSLSEGYLHRALPSTKPAVTPAPSPDDRPCASPQGFREPAAAI
jgi:hypothetical protein